MRKGLKADTEEKEIVKPDVLPDDIKMGEEVDASSGNGSVPNIVFVSDKKKKFNKKGKRIVIIILVLCVLSAAAYMVWKLFTPKETVVQTAFAMRGPLQATVMGSGIASPKEKADIVPLAVGTVMKVYVANGDKVSKGDPIYTVDSSSLEEQLTEAYASRQRISDDLTKANEKIDNLNVKAPISGKVMDVKVKLGDYMSEGSTMATIIDDSKMKLTMYFSYAYINAIKVGQEALVSIPQSMSTVKGTVESVENIKRITSQGTVLFSAEIVFDNPGALTKDMLATAVVSTPSGDVMPAEAGHLEYNKEMTLSAKSSGEIIDLKMKNYYEYSQGDTVCVLKNDTLSSDISGLQKDLQNSNDNIKELEQKKENYSVVSPISGTIMSCTVTEGDELSGSGSVVVSIANLDKMVVEIQIDEMDVGRLTVGMPVNFTVDTMNGTKNYFGTLTSVAMQGTAQNGVSFFPGTAEIQGDETLMSGMYLNYNIVTMDIPDCVSVPNGAVQYTETGTVVFVKKGGAEPEKTVELGEGVVPEGFYAMPIEIGETNGTQTEILSGLTEGMEIADMGGDPNNGGMGGGMGGGKIMVSSARAVG